MAELRAPFRLDLLGAFRLIAPNGERIDISSRKGMALVAIACCPVMFAGRRVGSGASLRDVVAASRAGDRRALYTIAVQQVVFGFVPLAVSQSILVDSWANALI